MNAPFIERSRSGCALHGALATLGAIEGVVPIVHSTAGCGIQYQRGVTPFGGAVPSAAGFGPPLSSSNIGEKHVVFGGSSRLREQLKNSVKVVPGDLYVVVTGCATEMVGDDIPAMTKEGREQGFPVIHANTPGFHGSVHRGYEIAVRALVEQLTAVPDTPVAPVPGVVNLLGVIPQQDVFWQGLLSGLSQLLSEIGLTVNPLLGLGQTVDSWKRVSRADLNLVLSPWGRDAAILLEQRYGTRWLDIGGVPVGAAATARLLDLLTDGLRLNTGVVDLFRLNEEQVLQAKLAGLAPLYFASGFQRDFAIIGELALVSGITEFLVATLGLMPKLAVVTDPLVEEQRAALAAPLRGILAPFETEPLFTEDAAEIADLVRASDCELVIGSAFERSIADELDVPFLSISFPLADRLVLDRGYVGYAGAIALVEDIGSAILGRRPS